MNLCSAFADDLVASADLQSATGHLFRLGQAMGFSVVAFVQNIGTFEKTPAAGHRDDYIQNWIAHENGMQSLVVPDMYAHCPITNRAKREHRPFAWRIDDPRGFARRGVLAARQAAVVRFLRRFRVTGGITTPVHRPAGEVGLVSWMVTDGDDEPGVRLDECGHTLFLLAHHFISFCRAARVSERVPASIRLSEREIECLRWAAMGKTEREIGDLIARSENTARYHLKNAARKLHANNRTHAVAKACQYGLLGEIL